MKPALFVATPCRDGTVSTGYVRMLIGLTSAGRMDVHWHATEHCSFIPLARNLIANAFLASGASHAFFCDADMHIPDEAVWRMVAADVDYLSAAGVARTTRQLAINLDPSAPVERGMMQVRRARVACTVLRRGVLERLIATREAKPFKMTLAGAEYTGHDFFSGGLEGDELVAEDDAFSLRCSRAGIPQHVLLDVDVWHAGTMANAARTLEAARAKGGA